MTSTIRPNKTNFRIKIQRQNERTDSKQNPLETKRMQLQKKKKINLFSGGTITGGQTNIVI